ncbi:MAG TPA: sensor histidine kinase [Rhizomicrobium sp.]
MDARLAHANTEEMPLPGQTDIVAEANHRIANSLALLVGLVRMQAASVRKSPVPLSNADVRLLLEGVAARIHTISQLHRILSHVAPEGAVSLKPQLREVTDALAAALSSPQQEMRVEHGGDDCLVLMRQVQPIGLILCEIFINAMKYAHPAGVPLSMRVTCNAGADGRLVLSVCDDGVGLPEGFNSRKQGGLGFRVMYSLAAEIGADLQIESTALGLNVRLSLPASAMTGARLA